MLAVFGLAILVVIWVLSVFAASVAGDAAAFVPVVVAAFAVDFGAFVNKLEVGRVRAAAVVVAHLLHHLVELCKQGLGCLSTRGAYRVCSSTTGSLMVMAVSVRLRWGSLRGVLCGFHEAGAFVAR